MIERGTQLKQARARVQEATPWPVNGWPRLFTALLDGYQQGLQYGLDAVRRSARTCNAWYRAGQESRPITLSDGTTIPVRPIQPTDTAALQRFHRRLSLDSVYRRFFGFVRELTEERARYFTHVDGENRYALVALDPAQPNEIIGVVRYDREAEPDRAECAVIVEDRWQGHGVGLELMRRLVAAARARGIRVLDALVLADNTRMLQLLADLGVPTRVRAERGDDGGSVRRVELLLQPEARGTDQKQGA